MLEPLVRKIARIIRQSRDANFIGYDKYRNLGAHHWKMLKNNSDHYRDKVEVVVQELPKDATCIDLGCGDGAYAYHVSLTARSVIGVDADYDAINHARKKFSEMGVKNAKLFQSAFGDLPKSFYDLTRGGVDAVYSMDVIEHLPRPEELLEVAKRVLKPGGKVLIGTPLFIREDLISKYHIKEFRHEEIKELISRYFRIEKEIYFPTRRPDGVTYEKGFYIGVGTQEATV